MNNFKIRVPCLIKSHAQGLIYIIFGKSVNGREAVIGFYH